MNHSILPLLSAPEGGGALTLTIDRQEEDEIIDGVLTDAGGREYPIEDGIPRLLPAHLWTQQPAAPEVAQRQQSEMAARDAQVDDYDRMKFLSLFGRVEIPLTIRMLSPRADDRLLEAGCGTGRMTSSLARTARELVAVDFSFESLRRNAAKLRNQGIKNVHLVQADLCHLPFMPAVFSRIVSCQVLEHVPGNDARCQAVGELARVGRPGSRLVLSAYKHSLFTKMFAHKEGDHDGGIPYYRFDAAELRALLSTAFDVQGITGALVYIYVARCVKKQAPAG
jgi:SAM-dependent methyltransferase